MHKLSLEELQILDMLLAKLDRSRHEEIDFHSSISQYVPVLRHGVIARLIEQRRNGE